MKKIWIVNIGGASSNCILDTFTELKSKQDVSRESDADISSNHWTKQCRSRMNRLAEGLIDNADKLPTIFFAAFNDMWSLPASPARLLPAWEERAVVVASDKFSLECYPLPDRDRLLDEIKKMFRRKAIRERNPQEDRWTLCFLQEALLAWQLMVREAVLVWISEPLSASVDDEEVQESLDQVSPWIREIGKK